MTFEPFMVVVIPFPFTDSAQTKKRKAFVLSKNDFHTGSGTLVLAMITSAQESSWPGDVFIGDLISAGLKKTCVARMKIFTLDEALVIEKAGVLSKRDQETIMTSWRALLAL